MPHILPGLPSAFQYSIEKSYPDASPSTISPSAPGRDTRVRAVIQPKSKDGARKTEPAAGEPALKAAPVLTHPRQE